VYVYEVSEVSVPVPALHEAQALFVKSQAYPVAQSVQVKAAAANILPANSLPPLAES